MKNCRDICAAEDAGFVEYAGLPGRVKTGCMESPEQRSKFCLHHKPRQRSDTGNQSCQGKIVEMILSKKSTRTSTVYEVITMHDYYFDAHIVYIDNNRPIPMNHVNMYNYTCTCRCYGLD